MSFRPKRKMVAEKHIHMYIPRCISRKEKIKTKVILSVPNKQDGIDSLLVPPPSFSDEKKKKKKKKKKKTVVESPLSSQIPEIHSALPNESVKIQRPSSVSCLLRFDGWPSHIIHTRFMKQIR
jgi:hypothetical protein